MDFSRRKSASRLRDVRLVDDQTKFKGAPLLVVSYCVGHPSLQSVMAGPARTPESSTTSNPPSLKKSTSGSQSSMTQKSIASFFQKRSHEGQAANVNVPRTLPVKPQPADGIQKRPAKPARGSSQSLTPAPSSDAVLGEDIQEDMPVRPAKANGANGLPSPITPASDAPVAAPTPVANASSLIFDSPSRKV